jgi:hypothetical protein
LRLRPSVIGHFVSTAPSRLPHLPSVIGGPGGDFMSLLL